MCCGGPCCASAFRLSSKKKTRVCLSLFCLERQRLLTEHLLQHSINITRHFTNPSAKTRHPPRRTKLAAARRATSNFARRLCRVFARGFAKLRVNFQQSVAIIVPSTVVWYDLGGRGMRLATTSGSCATRRWRPLKPPCWRRRLFWVAVLVLW